MYKCKYFSIEELVSPELFEIIGEDKCWALLPEIVKYNLDRIREEYSSAYDDTIRINDWHMGGDYKYSGVRPYNCPIGAKRSRHKQWIAFDLKPWSGDIENLQEIIKTFDSDFNLSRVENFNYTPSWCHIEIHSDYYVNKTTYFNP
jgi:hypothetical protein